MFIFLLNSYTQNFKISFNFFFVCLSFCLFLGPLPRHMEVTRLGVQLELQLPALTQVSVDTVERYQGSQREVIIVSFCCHHEHQLELMVSPNEDGTVDRKLNVALTRARQQLLLLGNELMLSRAPHHAALLEKCGVLPD